MLKCLNLINRRVALKAREKRSYVIEIYHLATKAKRKNCYFVIILSVLSTIHLGSYFIPKHF